MLKRYLEDSTEKVDGLNIAIYFGSGSSRGADDRKLVHYLKMRINRVIFTCRQGRCRFASAREFQQPQEL